MNTGLRKMKFENGEVFFAIGENICWAGTEIQNPNFPAGFTNYWDMMSSPRYHEQQRSFLHDLAVNQGNFVRIRLDPWSVPIESFDKTVPLPVTTVVTRDLVRYVNNYHHNQMFMWEMDKTLSVCEEGNLRIMLNILNDIELNVNDTSVYDPGSLCGWARNPYSGLLNDSTLEGIQKFFVSPEANETFKLRLRYIEARWGYSTSLGVWELINETENISGDYHHSKPNYKLWDESAGFRNSVYGWLCNMRTELQSHYPPHLVTTGMSGGRGVPDTDAADHLPCMDIVEKHDYTIEFNQEAQKYSSRDYNKNQEAIKYYHLQRPFIWGEAGLADGVSPLNVYGDATYHNSVWASIFSGAVGTVLNFKDWGQQAGFAHRNNFNGVKAFTDRINFKQKLVPCINNSDQEGPYTEYSESKVITYWLKREDNALAYGWSRNSGYNWMSETFPNLPTKDKIAMKKETGWNGESELFSFEKKDEMIRLKNLRPRTKYKIEFYNTWDDYDLLETDYQKSDKHGLLSFGRRMPYQKESPWYPDYAFIISQVKDHDSKFDKRLAEGVYPVPASDILFIDLHDDAEIYDTVLIVDLLGRTSEKEIINGNRINISDLQEGIYILRIRNIIFEQTLKFIVLRS
jgi:hypothetical protein